MVLNLNINGLMLLAETHYVLNLEYDLNLTIQGN
jgi:hypothetical protein